MTTWKRALFGLTALAAVSGVASGSQAQTCSSASDCPQGTVCQMSHVEVCPPVATCPPGADCPAPPPCEPTQISQCVPAPCSDDSDCGAGMVCFASENVSCAAPPPCAAGEKCPSTPADCTTTTTHTCTPRYELPCSEDADCGDGFTCVAPTECACKGSSGIATPNAGGNSSSSASPSLPPTLDAGAALPTDGKPAQPIDAGAPEAIDAGCECHPSAVKACQLKDIACETDADCPPLLTCQALNVGTAVACGPVLPGTDAGACSAPTPPPSASEKRCAPAYKGVANGLASSAPQLAGVPATPSSSGGSTGSANDRATPPPTHQTSDSETDAGVAPAHEPAAGCSVAASSANDARGALELGLMCAALCWTLRRKRRA